MIVETVRVSEKAKSQLITLKRKTGIQNWNVLCRWALMRSLAEPSIPPHEEIVADSSIEMSWKTFAGDYGDAITGLVLMRMSNDGINMQDNKMKSDFFKLHLHRGISYLTITNDVNSLF